MTIGFASSSRQPTRCRMMYVPSVNWSRFDVVNSRVIIPSPCWPAAMIASGTPMLPQLLNIIGGTKVFGSPCSRRA
jgi:hypothetical protein